MRCAWCGEPNPSDARFCLRCGKGISEGLIPGKCPRCGMINAIDAAKCVNCGGPVPETGATGPLRGRPQLPCRWCGKPTAPGESECWECLHRGSDASLSTMGEHPSDRLTIAAVLMGIAGGLALVQGLFYVFVGSMPGVEADVSGFFACCGVLDVLFGLGGLAGAYFAGRRTNYSLALLGAVVAMLGFGLVVGFFLGLGAMIMISGRRSEFR